MTGSLQQAVRLPQVRVLMTLLLGVGAGAAISAYGLGDAVPVRALEIRFRPLEIHEQDGLAAAHCLCGGDGSPGNCVQINVMAAQANPNS